MKRFVFWHVPEPKDVVVEVKWERAVKSRSMLWPRAKYQPYGDLIAKVNAVKMTTNYSCETSDRSNFLFEWQLALRGVPFSRFRIAGQALGCCLSKNAEVVAKRIQGVADGLL